jgi:hypothetical protein
MEPHQPGWYRDPKRPGGRRYWDGHAWVDVDGVTDAAPESSPVAAATPRLISQRRNGGDDEARAEIPDQVAGEQDTESQAD